MTVNNVLDLKKRQLQMLAAERDSLRGNPELQWLFFEITGRCNLRCSHCGSRCTEAGNCLSVKVVTGFGGTESPILPAGTTFLTFYTEPI